MRAYLRYSVSAISLLAAMSLAQAQLSDRQGGEKGGAAEHMQGERGGAMQREGGAAERQGNEHGAPQHERGAAQHEGGAARQEAGREHGKAQQEDERSAKKEQQRGEYREEGERGGMNERQTKGGHENMQERRSEQNQRQGTGHRTAKAGQNPADNEQGQAGQNAQEKREQRPEGKGTPQRQSNVGGAAKNEDMGRKENGGATRANIHISAPQRTELHEAVIHDSAIHVYHQGDLHFAVRVGERIPDMIEFYAPPPRFVEIDPVFRRYRIIALESEILVVDPATREIVDIIPV